MSDTCRPKGDAYCLFWDNVDSFAGLFDGFYQLFTGESTSKADKFDNLGSMKILNMPHTQKRSWIRTKETLRGTKPPNKKGCNQNGLEDEYEPKKDFFEKSSV